MIDDIDAITPCPMDSHNHNHNHTTSRPELQLQLQLQLRSTSPCSSYSSISSSLMSRRRESLKVIEEGTDGDPDRLWQRMLVLQQKFGCYNSARMSAALSSGNVSILRPSKACLDLLNENMTALPETVVNWLRH
ncbi:hypothetical protein GGS20DRAFT_232898 [Poronia punctata]|nr:hypothetical protein GGS20DRAFT_232898 [Poronia punctata]